MKKLVTIILITTFTAINMSCKKSTPAATVYTCASCKTTPEAIAANDASSKGIYKGVLIGSTGTIKFDISNSGTTVTAIITIDGVTTTLISTVVLTPGQPYVAPFSGTINGASASITFSVDANGGNPAITAASIPGHTGISFTIIKETSTSLILGYEGTYSSTKPETGTFNAIVSKTVGVWAAVSRKDGTTSVNHDGGRISGNNLVEDKTNIVVATINGDVVTGKFTDTDNSTVTVTGKRTL